MLNHDNNENQQTELEIKTMMRTTQLMLSGRLKGILLNLFPIITLLKQCKRLLH